MKRVGITGVSGLVGRALVGEMQERGWEVVGYSRAGRAWEGMEEVRDYGELDLSGLDAVVHLAGEPILGWWTAEKKEQIRASRVEGTRAVVDSLAKLGEEERPEVLVCASAIGYYGDQGDEILTEAAGPGEGFLAGVVREWESEAARAGELGMREVRARLGVVLAPDGGAASMWKRIFSLGLGGRLGSGKQWVSWVSLRDVVKILGEAVEKKEVRGAVNLVSPHPVRNEELTRVIGKVLRRPAILPVPGFALRMALGGMEEMLLQSQRVEPGVLRGRGYVWREGDLEKSLRGALGKES